jgi:hypothetical protein
MSKDAAGQLPVERRTETTPPKHVTDGPGSDELESPDRRLVAGLARDAGPGDSGPPLLSRQLVALQRSIGNRAVSDLLAARRSSRAAASQVLGHADANRAAWLAVQRHAGPSMPQELEPGTGTGTGTGGGGLDYVALATRIRDAVEGLGTDEEAIYAALGELQQDAARITALTTAYGTLTGRTLDADLVDDLSGDELARAQRLLHPPDRRQQIETLLGTTDTGRWALAIIQRWSIPVDYEFSGTGSFHRAGSIFINRTLSVDAAVLVMMHEAQHANTFKSGQAADVDALSREEYIRRKIADEAEAVVRQIEGSVPMQAAGHSLVGSGINQGLIDRYRTAFYAYRDLLEANNPTMTRAEINRRCRTRTRDTEVTSWFHDGTFVTSTGNITYSQHYGNSWDESHNPPSPAPRVTGEANE